MNKKKDIRWLLVGAFGGLVAAAVGLLDRNESAAEIPDHAAAMVNGVVIAREDLDRLLARFEGSDREDVLSRLIDNELLIQRGVDLGMTESEMEVRNAISNSLIASVTAEADAANPDDETLRAHMSANQERFSFTSALMLEAWVTDEEPLAQNLVAALRNGNEVASENALEPIAGLPSALAATDAFREHLGPAITAAAADMPPGSSAIFARRGRWMVVRVLENERSALADLDTVRNRVLLDYRRTLADDALSAYLDGLRERAEIRVAAP